MKKSHLTGSAALFCALLVSQVNAYPLDGEAESGIRRLEGYQLMQAAPGGAKLSAGQLWTADSITLNLLDYDGPDFDALPEDEALKKSLTLMFKQRDSSYSMVLLDFSDSTNIRWAGLRPDLKQNPGSVGKLLCMAALFHALANAFPDTGDRTEVLRTSISRAGDWVSNESHQVPKWDSTERRNRFAVINQKDEFRLSEWLDHAISASANGAGSIVWREAMLVEHFGAAYPPSDAQAQAFFAETPKKDLSALAQEVINAPLRAAGLNVENIQQGSFFTGNSKRKVPGGMSFATPRELTRLLFRIEQGKLVDAWSSLQMKKYMYLTKRRYRYSYAPELADDAVFFKSGSLYSCREEEGFVCQKYMGNKQNLMNSVAVVEGNGDSDVRYIAVLMSNVMRFNSAWDHSRIAAAAHQVMLSGKPQALRETATDKEMKDAGRSD